MNKPQLDWIERLRYWIWAAVRFPFGNAQCPECQSGLTQVVKRKYLVTALYRCPECQLLFRYPNSGAIDDWFFYQYRYKQGFTTDLPDDVELRSLLACSFKDTEKDYSPYLKVIDAIGIKPGEIILDYGSSWGYGSWQFLQAGYRVYSYEISKPRAQYAASKLNCIMLDQPQAPPEKVNCFFSAHVIEHLPTTKVLWDIALQVVKPGGTIVIFTPNGDPRRELIIGKKYHQLWGQAHPLLFSPEAIKRISIRYGFIGSTYSTPYNLEKIRGGIPEDEFPGEELLFISRKF